MSAARQDLPQGPHPLAVALAAALRPGDRVLVVGAGKGRSLGVLEAAGLVVTCVAADWQPGADDVAQFAAVLTTHALLHGTCATVAMRVTQLTSLLGEGGRFYATFGSTADRRFGIGTHVAGDGWVPPEGADEAGVAHAFFARRPLEDMLEALEILGLEERDVQESAGRWAHAAGAGPSVHWFVEAIRR